MRGGRRAAEAEVRMHPVKILPRRRPALTDSRSTERRAAVPMQYALTRYKNFVFLSGDSINLLKIFMEGTRWLRRKTM